MAAVESNLGAEVRAYWVAELMSERRTVRAVQGNVRLLEQARRRVDRAKHALGERGPVWWEGGEPDLNRHLITHSPYAAWFAQAAAGQSSVPEAKTPPIDDELIAEQLFRLLETRAPQSSTCPSEVARAIAPANEKAWRSLMPQIRNVVRGLMRTQQVQVTRGKQTLKEDEFAGGPIRVRRGPRFKSPER